MALSDIATVDAGFPFPWVSGAFGTLTLATDKWLWFVAPTHAYGLGAFVVIDMVLVAGMWRKTRLAIEGALLLAAIQLIAMFGDVVTGQPAGVHSSGFMHYLFTDTAFLTLLVLQGIILILSIGTFAMPLLHGHRLSFLRIRKD